MQLISLDNSPCSSFPHKIRVCKVLCMVYFTKYHKYDCYFLSITAFHPNFHLASKFLAYINKFKLALFLNLNHKMLLLLTQSSSSFRFLIRICYKCRLFLLLSPTTSSIFFKCFIFIFNSFTDFLIVLIINNLWFKFNSCYVE